MDEIKVGISLESIGIITGIVLCILNGVGVIDIGWFWATFPFWIGAVVELAIFGIFMLCVAISILIAKRSRR